MSGGYFDYKQYEIYELADRVRELAHDSRKGYRKDVLDRIGKASRVLLKAYKMVDAVDWLVSDDISEDEFCRRFDKQGVKK